MTISASKVIPSALLGVREMASLQGCSPRHVYRMSDSGQMPSPLRIGALVRWQRQGIESWIAAGCKPCRKAERS